MTIVSGPSSPQEDQLAREFAPLIAQGLMATPGEDAQVELQLAGVPIGAAVTRYGGLLPGAQNAENFLLAKSAPSTHFPQRLVVAVSEGNYKAPVTVVAGTLALSELHRRVGGARRSDNLEDDVRVALAQAVQRLTELERLKPPPVLTRWRFDNFFTTAPAMLQGLASSLTAVAVAGRDAVLAHVGECHAYLARASERSLRRLSADHTLAAQPDFQEWVRRDPEKLLLFGSLPCWVLGNSPLADIQIEWLRLDPGDTLLLCSSSLRKGRASDELLHQILQDAEPRVASERLLATAPRDTHPALSTTVAILRVPD